MMNFNKNPFVNKQQSQYDVLGRKTVEQVKEEMSQIKQKKSKEEIQDLQTDFKKKMDSLRNIGKI